MNYHSWRITQIFFNEKEEMAGNRRKGKESSGDGWKGEESGMTGKGKPSVHPPAGC